MNGLFMTDIKAAIAETMMDKNVINCCDCKSVCKAFAVLTDKLEMLMNADYTELGEYTVTVSDKEPEVKDFMDALVGKRLDG